MPQIPSYEAFKPLISKDAFLSSFELLNSVLPKKAHSTYTLSFMDPNDFKVAANDQSGKEYVEGVVKDAINEILISTQYFEKGYNIVAVPLIFNEQSVGMLQILYFGEDTFKLYLSLSGDEYEFTYNKATDEIEYNDKSIHIMPTEDILYMISKVHLMI